MEKHTVVEAALTGFIEQVPGKELSDGKIAVVRNGYQPDRNIQTGIEPVTVKIPKVRAKDGDPVTFKYCKLYLQLYLRNIRTGATKAHT